MKRLLNCTTSDFRQMHRQTLKQAIIASEGRTVLGETIVTSEPLVEGLSNPEVAAAFGADLLLLNKCDLLQPLIGGIAPVANPLAEVQRLTGRPVGLSLEAIDPQAPMLENQLLINEGRQLSEKTLQAAMALGMDFLCLSGNPATRVSHRSILNAIRFVRQHYDGLIIAGKMHKSGVNEKLLDTENVLSFVHAGADAVLLPAPGTVPGVCEAMLTETVAELQAAGAICISTIGTSQESADAHTVRQIALASKRCGIDVQHIGDGGFSGIAAPENIMALSIAIRGKRHTYFRMAASINR